jgi:hypothetical protein
MYVLMMSFGFESHKYMYYIIMVDRSFNRASLVWMRCPYTLRPVGRDVDCTELSGTVVDMCANVLLV